MTKRLSGPGRRTGAPGVLSLAAFALAGPALFAEPPLHSTPPSAAPTVAGSIRPTAVVSSPLGMVVTSAPEASWAGVRMLEAGGNAVDAAVAAAFALTAGDPGGSGLGGQTWMVIRLATGEERAVFCPARAPMRTDPARVKAARRESELWGPMAAAVPTTVATLAHALARYGTKPFAEVLAPAIEAADAGYRIQSFETGYLASYARRLFDSEILLPVYLTGPTGESGLPDPAPVGRCVRIPGLSDTLRRLAEAGAGDFYSGTIARKIDEAMSSAGGFVRMGDLMRVPSQVQDVTPVRGAYRDLTALSVPSPAGGSVFVMALQILDAIPAGRLAAPGLERGHSIVEAVRLARAESVSHAHQAEIVEGPLRSKWLSKEWAAGRAARIRPDRALPADELPGGAGAPTRDRGTSHVSVVDAQGNAVSLTQTLGRYYGAAWAAPSLAFPMNALLEPFESDDPDSRGSLRPGSSPPSPSTPVILLRGGRTAVVAGTAGSSRIPSILLNLVTGLVDGGDHPVDAWSRPRVLWEDDDAGPRVMLEIAPPFDAGTVATLEKMGYDRVFALTAPGADTTVFGGIHAIVRDGASPNWVAVVDGRRPAVAAAPSSIAGPGR